MFKKENSKLRVVSKAVTDIQNRVLDVKGEVENCSVGISVAFETADDVCEHQKVSQDLWPRLQT